MPRKAKTKAERAKAKLKAPIFDEAWKSNLRMTVRFMYDIQHLRTAAGQRHNYSKKYQKLKKTKVPLKKGARNVFSLTEDNLKLLETAVGGEVKRLICDHPLYKEFLVKQNGIAHIVSGIILSHFDIHKSHAVSNMWSYAGLSVVGGKFGVSGVSPKTAKGVRANYNPWLRAKMVGVMADNLIRVAGLDEYGYYYTTTPPNPSYKPNVKEPKDAERYCVRLHDVNDSPTEEEMEACPEWQKTVSVQKPVTEVPWRKFYDDYKHRKNSQVMEVCQNCEGKGEYLATEDDKTGKTLKKDRKKEVRKCGNCNGTGGPAPWGKSDDHRHKAAKRYLAKMFLKEVYVVWRTMEGLPVRAPFEEEYHGKTHHVG